MDTEGSSDELNALRNTLAKKNEIIADYEGKFSSLRQKTKEYVEKLVSEKTVEQARATSLEQALQDMQAEKAALKESTKAAIEDARKDLRSRIAEREEMDTQLADAQAHLQLLQSQVDALKLRNNTMVANWSSERARELEQHNTVVVEMKDHIECRETRIRELESALSSAAADKAHAVKLASEENAEKVRELVQAQSRALEQREEALLRLSSLQKLHSQTQAELESALNQTRMLESERIAQRNMVAAFQKEHHETVQALRDARQQIDTLQSERGMLVEEMSRLKSDLKSTEAELFAARSKGTDELTNSRNSFSADQHQEQDTSTPSQLRILEEQLTQAKDEIQTARDAHRSALLAQKLAEARELEMRVEKDALAQRDKELEYELANLSKANAEKSGEEARLRDEIAALRAGVQSYETELLKMTERIAELQTQAEKAESAFLHAEQFGIEAQAEKGDLFSKVAQLEKERDALSLASEYLTKQYTSVSQELHEAKLEISAIKKQLQAVQAQASLDDSAATKALAESRAQTQEVQAHLEVLRQSEQNMHILFQEKDRELLALREESQAVEQRSRQQLSRTQSTATQKIAQLSTDLDAAQLALQTSQAKLAESETNLSATRMAHTSLQEQYDQLSQAYKLAMERSEYEKADMKKKMKSFVEKVMAEKNTAESVAQEVTAKMSTELEKSAELSQRLVQLQHQLESVTARAALDKDVYDGELNAMKNAHTLQLMEKDQQIAYLQERASAGQKMTEEQIREAQERLSETEQALMENKSKRLAARSETINLATELEKLRETNAHVKHLLQYSLLPVATEQVCALESALPALEAATSLVANKRTVKLQTRTQQLLARRFQREGAHDLSEQEIFSRDSPRAGALTSTNSSRFTLGRLQESVLASEAVSHVTALRTEMDRVTAGLKLLAHAIERLNELVALDTRCCGSVYDLLRLSMQTTLTNGYGIVNTTDNDTPQSEIHRQDSELEHLRRRNSDGISTSVPIELQGASVPYNVTMRNTRAAEQSRHDLHEIAL